MEKQMVKYRIAFALTGTAVFAGVLYWISRPPSNNRAKGSSKGSSSAVAEGVEEGENSNTNATDLNALQEIELNDNGIHEIFVGSGHSTASRVLTANYIKGLLKICDACDRGSFVSESKKHYKNIILEGNIQLKGIGYFKHINGTNVVVVTKPSWVASILKNETRHNLDFIGKAVTSFFGKNVLFTTEGDAWKKFRGIMASALSVGSTGSLSHYALYSQKFTAISKRIVDVLKKKQGEAVDMYRVFTLYHFGSVGSIAFSDDFGYPDDLFSKSEVIEAFEYLLREIPKRVYGPASTHELRTDYLSDNEENRVFNKHSKIARGKIEEIVDKRIENNKNGIKPPNDFLQTLLGYYQDSSSSKYIDREEVVSSVLSLFFAGLNTAVVEMCFTLFYLAQNPKWYERVFNEVDSIKGSDRPMSDYPLLNNIFLETLRLVPAIPLVSRYLEHDTPLQLQPNGKAVATIPKNTQVWLPILYLHQSRSSFGDDVLLFNPKRWEKENPCPEGSFLPFSLGPRDCIGQSLAKLQSITIMSHLFKELYFEIPVNSHQTPTFTGFGIQPYDIHGARVAMDLVVRTRSG